MATFTSIMILLTMLGFVIAYIVLVSLLLFCFDMRLFTVKITLATDFGNIDG